MTKNPLFSTYRQGENRVTSSMLAVFERIDLSLLETILASAAGEASLAMLTFTNQPPGKGRSVPDARISGRFSYWFEVKTARNALDPHQLSEHLANLGSEADDRLFVITPDADQPNVVSKLGDPRLVWFNFRSLHDAIESSSLDPGGPGLDGGQLTVRLLSTKVPVPSVVPTPFEKPQPPPKDRPTRRSGEHERPHTAILHLSSPCRRSPVKPRRRY